MEEINFKDENNKKLLDCVYQTANSTIMLYSFIINKSCNAMLKKQLEKDKETVCKIKNECEVLAKTLNCEIQQNNWFEKIKNKVVLNVNAFIDDSTEFFAKKIIKQHNDNIISIITQVDSTPNAITEVVNLASELQKFLEKQQNSVKKYLVKNPGMYNKQQKIKPDPTNKKKQTKEKNK